MWFRHRRDRTASSIETPAWRAPRDQDLLCEETNGAAIAPSLARGVAPRLTHVQPRHQQKATDQTKMLEELVFRHEAAGRGELPEPVCNKRGRERESGEPQGTEPSEYTGQDESGSAKLGNDRCDRHGRGGLQSEMPHFGNSAFEVQDLVDAALQISGAKPEQRDVVNDWRRNDRSSARPKPLAQRFAGHLPCSIGTARQPN